MSFLSNLRSNKLAQSVKTSRMDGHSQYNADILVKFQAIVEREPDVDYEALRAALLWARNEREHVVTMTNLRAQYNNVLYSAAEVAYSNR